MLVLGARAALYKCIPIIGRVAAGAANAYALLPLLLLWLGRVLMLVLVLMLWLEGWLLRLRLIHRIHAPIDISLRRFDVEISRCRAEAERLSFCRRQAGCRAHVGKRLLAKVHRTGVDHGVV